MPAITLKFSATRRAQKDDSNFDAYYQGTFARSYEIAACAAGINYVNQLIL